MFVFDQHTSSDADGLLFRCEAAKAIVKSQEEVVVARNSEVALLKTQLRLLSEEVGSSSFHRQHYVSIVSFKTVFYCSSEKRPR